MSTGADGSVSEGCIAQENTGQVLQEVGRQQQVRSPQTSADFAMTIHKSSHTICSYVCYLNDRLKQCSKAVVRAIAAATLLKGNIRRGKHA